MSRCFVVCFGQARKRCRSSRWCCGPRNYASAVRPTNPLAVGVDTRGHSDACGHPCRVKFRFLQTPCGFPCRVCKILARWSMGSRLLAYFFISCGVSLCKIPEGPTRKGILLRNTYFFACARPSVSDDDCSVPGTTVFFHRC